MPPPPSPELIIAAKYPPQNNFPKKSRTPGAGPPSKLSMTVQLCSKMSFKLLIQKIFDIFGFSFNSVCHVRYIQVFFFLKGGNSYSNVT